MDTENVCASNWILKTVSQQRADWTGELVFNVLYSYVEELVNKVMYNLEYLRWQTMRKMESSGLQALTNRL